MIINGLMCHQKMCIRDRFKVSVVLIDGSFACSRQKTLTDECTALGIHFISLAEKPSEDSGSNRLYR